MAGTRDEEIGTVKTDERTRLQDQIDCLKSERDRLRARLNEIGGSAAEVQLERVRGLQKKWVSTASELVSASMDPHLSVDASVAYRTRAARLKELASELSEALR